MCFQEWTVLRLGTMQWARRGMPYFTLCRSLVKELQIFCSTETFRATWTGRQNYENNKQSKTCVNNQIQVQCFNKVQWTLCVTRDCIRALRDNVSFGLKSIIDQTLAWMYTIVDFSEQAVAGTLCKLSTTNTQDIKRDAGHELIFIILLIR